VTCPTALSANAFPRSDGPPTKKNATRPDPTPSSARTDDATDADGILCALFSLVVLLSYLVWKKRRRRREEEEEREGQDQTGRLRKEEEEREGGGETKKLVWVMMRLWCAEE